jgi:hypothetical protein
LSRQISLLKDMDAMAEQQTGDGRRSSVPDLLVLGRKNYSCRVAVGCSRRKRRFDIPEWRGEPLEGKRLLIWHEPGTGDDLLSASRYPDVIARAAQVVIECERWLVPLFARSFPRATVRAVQPLHGRSVVETADCDYHVAAALLPELFRGEPPGFFPRSSWLFPDPARILDWRRQLDGLGGALRVGIAWRSRIMTAGGPWSCVPLDHWGAVFGVADVTFINLQHEVCQPELERAEGRFGVPVYELKRLDPKDEVENTAALVASLDLVIAPPNSVAELAGALGVPVWCFGTGDGRRPGGAPHLRYPSVRAFGPPVGSSLPDALDRIAAALRRTVETVRPRETPGARRKTRSRKPDGVSPHPPGVPTRH